MTIAAWVSNELIPGALPVWHPQGSVWTNISPLYPSFSFGLISSGSIKNFINVDSLGFGQSIWVVHSFFAILYNVILDSLFLKLTIQGQMLYFLELFKYRECSLETKYLYNKYKAWIVPVVVGLFVSFPCVRYRQQSSPSLFKYQMLLKCLTTRQ